MIRVVATARSAALASDDIITSGSVGIPVAFELSEDDFEGLACTAVFQGSGVARDVALIDGAACKVPAECLAEAGGVLRIGIYASNAEGTVVIPTVWANSRPIEVGTVPSDRDPAGPTPDWTAQVQEAAAEALSIAQSVEQRADAGDFDGEQGPPGRDAELRADRVTSLTNTPLSGGAIVEAVGIPIYVNDVSQYAEYGITDKGWYTLARIAAPAGMTVCESTVVAGDAGHIATDGASYVDVAVRFGVTAMSQAITVQWSDTLTETFVFRATDLAVRNLDYRATFYLYDLDPFVTWQYALTTDAKFLATKNYYTEADGVYTLAEVTVGEDVPANTYYTHSKAIFSGMTRNVTYKLNTMIDCPVEIVLPVVDDDGYGAWFEIQMRYSGSFSTTLTPPDSSVKIGTAQTQAQTAGINVLDLQYSDVCGAKLWTLLNTHSNIPT